MKKNFLVFIGVALVVFFISLWFILVTKGCPKKEFSVKSEACVHVGLEGISKVASESGVDYYLLVPVDTGGIDDIEVVFTDRDAISKIIYHRFMHDEPLVLKLEKRTGEGPCHANPKIVYNGDIWIYSGKLQLD